MNKKLLKENILFYLKCFAGILFLFLALFHFWLLLQMLFTEAFNWYNGVLIIRNFVISILLLSLVITKEQKNKKMLTIALLIIVIYISTGTELAIQNYMNAF